MTAGLSLLAAASACGLIAPSDDPRRNQSISAETDQIITSAETERFANQIVIGRIFKLQKRALHGFFVRRFGYIDRRHIAGIKPCMIHAGAQCAGRGIEVLYLLRLVADIA